MAKVSIIVPVYNTEKYVEECLLSLKNQTYSNIEIVVVNDGSTDNSLKICQKFTGSDDRFKIISKENQGLNDARRTGFENSTGDWIVFVDSDDYIDVDFVKKMLNLATKNNADLVVCEMCEFTDGQKPVKNSKNQPPRIMTDRVEILKWNAVDIHPDFIGHTMTAWGKIFARSLFSQVDFQKSNYRQNEDEFFLVQFYAAAQKVVIDFEQLYFYRQQIGQTLSKQIKNNLFIPENREIGFMDFGYEYFIKNHQFISSFGFNIDQELILKSVHIINHRKNILLQNGLNLDQIKQQSKSVAKIASLISKNQLLTEDEKISALNLVSKTHPIRIWRKIKSILRKV